MLFGHNSTITDFAKSLLSPFSEEMPTCSIIGIRSNATEWAFFAEKKCELLFFDFPKKHTVTK